MNSNENDNSAKEEFQWSAVSIIQAIAIFILAGMYKFESADQFFSVLQYVSFFFAPYIFTLLLHRDVQNEKKLYIYLRLSNENRFINGLIYFKNLWEQESYFVQNLRRNDEK